jgi:hypothetical protein
MASEKAEEAAPDRLWAGSGATQCSTGTIISLRSVFTVRVWLALLDG